MDNEIIEGNKLIAEFMGYKYYPENLINGEAGTLEKDGKLSLHANIINKSFCTEYHSSWDWLMPVVEKIESLGNYVWIMHSLYDNDGILNQVAIGNIKTNACSSISTNRSIYKIEATWLSVVEFIKWYNQNK